MLLPRDGDAVLARYMPLSCVRPSVRLSVRMSQVDVLLSRLRFTYVVAIMALRKRFHLVS